MSEKINLSEILKQFDISLNAYPYGNGHINDTYCVEGPRYILQRINTSIFRNPEELMENIENVTSFIREKVEKEGLDPDRATLTIIKTVDGKNYYTVDEEHVYRVYKFIEDTKSIESDKTLTDLYHAGVGFGHFQKMLHDFPVTAENMPSVPCS